MARSTLSCCIAIKNEEKQIVDTLSCINILADEIIIIDTGSTDGTLSIVNKWIERFNAKAGVNVISVGDRFHDDDGDFDFGAAKTFAFENATKDFVMWLDATDRVTKQSDVKKQFIAITNKDKNVYFSIPTALSENFAFIRARIGPRKTAYVVGRIHEYMGFSNSPDLTRHFINHEIENKKTDRDLERNLRQLKKEWDIRPTSRICFYLALTYREMLNINDSLEWFRRRIYTYKFKDDFGEEYFKSLESVAEQILNIKRGRQSDMELYDMASQMIEKEPKRFEGYYYMGHYHKRREEYKDALIYFRKYTACKKPDTYKLWLNGAIYNGKAILTAINECNTALKYSKVLKPDEILDLNPSRSTFTSGNNQYY